MSEDKNGATWPAAVMAENVMEAGEQAVETQQEMLEQFVSMSTGSSGMEFPSFGPMNVGTATFKSRVQSGGRVSIPDAEREALDIEEGDIVQTIVVPVKRNRGGDDE